MSHLQIYKHKPTYQAVGAPSRSSSCLVPTPDPRLPTPKMGVRPRPPSRLRLPSLDCGVRGFRQGSTATRPVEGRFRVTVRTVDR